MDFKNLDLSKTNLHTHTTFCDGNNTPEKMVQAAIKKGIKTLGFSSHYYTECDTSYCMPRERVAEYIDCIENLKEKYKDQIEILCGIEQDYYSDIPEYSFDHVIGSVHYVLINGKYLPVDESIEFTKQAIAECDNDPYTLAEHYFNTVADVAHKVHPDIIGHFDLICKFNEKDPQFDESHPRYIAAWKKAVDALIPYDIPFEINTGAIARGYKSVPYPSPAIIEYIKENGGSFIYSSDSHSADTLDVWDIEL